MSSGARKRMRSKINKSDSIIIDDDDDSYPPSSGPHSYPPSSGSSSSGRSRHHLQSVDQIFKELESSSHDVGKPKEVLRVGELTTLPITLDSMPVVLESEELGHVMYDKELNSEWINRLFNVKPTVSFFLNTKLYEQCGITASTIRLGHYLANKNKPVIVMPKLSFLQQNRNCQALLIDIIVHNGLSVCTSIDKQGHFVYSSMPFLFFLVHNFVMWIGANISNKFPETLEIIQHVLDLLPFSCVCPFKRDSDYTTKNFFFRAIHTYNTPATISLFYYVHQMDVRSITFLFDLFPSPAKFGSLGQMFTILTDQSAGKGELTLQTILYCKIRTVSDLPYQVVYTKDCRAAIFFDTEKDLAETFTFKRRILEWFRCQRLDSILFLSKFFSTEKLDLMTTMSNMKYYPINASNVSMGPDGFPITCIVQPMVMIYCTSLSNYDYFRPIPNGFTSKCLVDYGQNVPINNTGTGTCELKKYTNTNKLVFEYQLTDLVEPCHIQFELIRNNVELIFKEYVSYQGQKPETAEELFNSINPKRLIIPITPTKFIFHRIGATYRKNMQQLLR